VKIDRCETCGGIYLDHGEVDMLLSIAKGPHGLRRVRSALQI
jgi:Zn-finger nucleic acid-binding protein